MTVSWAKETCSSFSSSSIAPQCKHDVFLSFSGVDTRKNFTGHLLAALEQNGFHTFRDDTKLNKGEDIGSELLKAIESSRISLIVFSKNYAASRWCLDELVKIMECRKTFQQIVLPIFYDVDPSDVRAQKGSVAEAFAKHEEHFKNGSNGKVEKWRAALTEAANLSGWDLKNVVNGHEAKLIEQITEEIGDKLSVTYLNVADHSVGLKCRLENLNALVCMDSNDVRIVGIWGIGGIGKTTIAKMLYNHIHRNFEGSCFLANVRETSKKINGLVVLQQQLLSDIVKNETHNIRNSDQGIEVIKRRVLSRRVLLVLDDVDNVQQLKALAINRDFFRLGSRIIITTRDKSFLNLLNVDEIYAPMGLNKNEALQLFSWYAFKKDHPIKDYAEVSCQVVDYAEGIPLALEVLGSYLCGRNIVDWKSAIAKLRKIPDDGIQGKLKISFDSLGKEVKELFQDIACFFIGMDRDFTIKILEGCNFDPIIGMGVLADRCLIRIGCKNQLEMHDMLRDMGREIVRQESLKEPGKRSRLWYNNDTLEVLRYGTGTETVEGLFLNFPESKEVQVNAKAFEKMNGLWLLHLNYVHLSSDFEHNFRRLLWLSWNGCPLEWLSSKLYMEKLVALDLRYSSLKQVWKGTKNLDNLKFLYLSHCYYLTKTPDFSGLNSLEELLLNDCTSLVEVDESIGCLKRLVVLDMANCKKLAHFPLNIWMLKSLEYLDLSGCSKLGELAGFKESPFKSRYTFLSSQALQTKNLDSIGLSLQGSSLKKLKMANCNLSHLPREIGSLSSLTHLDLKGNNLGTLPDSICNLIFLQNLDVAGCNISHLPSEMRRLISLTHLDLKGNNLGTLPGSICNLTCLERLFMESCNVSHLPCEIGRLVSLTHLDLNGNNLGTLPDSICNLTCLQYLYMSGCNISQLPCEIGRMISLTHLNLKGNNLSTLPNSIYNLPCLQRLNLANCNVSHLPCEIGRLISLKHLDLKGNNLRTLPDSICNLRCLQKLKLANCNVSHLPCEIGRLSSLTHLDLKGNNLCILPDSICNLTCLQNLYMSGCNLSYLPCEIGRLICLTHLDLEGNNLCTLPDSICNFRCLQRLKMKNCNVSHLPCEIGRLISLTHLDLRGNNLCTLPNSICNLTCLKELSISGCNVSHLPCEIGRLISLTHLDLEGNNLCTLPDSISNLTCLEELSMANCNLSDLPSEIWRLNSLQYWNLSGNGLRTLPDGISNLTHLGYLNLDKSAKLRSLPKLPASLDRLNASDCASLENIESEGLVGKTMILHGCHKLVENKFANNFIEVFTKHKEFSALKSSSEIILSGGEVPRWFQYQSAGSYLSFMVPPLINQKILGLIVCIVFFGSKEKCNDSSCLHYDIRNKNIVFLPDQSYHVQYQFIFEDQMWLKLLPQSCLEMKLEGGDEVEISIIVDEPIQVKRCGVNLVYEVDENVTKTNDEASTQYTSSPYQGVILEEAEVGSTN
ncbi:hypothetical protein ACSBR2_040041 [Camellia fascicularis]